MFITPLDPYSTLGTLLIVLLVTSFKEGYEDLQRARSDNEENNREVIVVTFVDGKAVETKKQSKEVILTIIIHFLNLYFNQFIAYH